MTITMNITTEKPESVLTGASNRSSARCADGNGTLTPLFFSDDNVDIARAKAICVRCTLQASCLGDALERIEPWGVWGGELIEDGRIVADRRPRGRPSVLPRPIFVLDEDRTIRSITNLAEQRPGEVVIRVA